MKNETEKIASYVIETSKLLLSLVPSIKRYKGWLAWLSFLSLGVFGWELWHANAFFGRFGKRMGCVPPPPPPPPPESMVGRIMAVAH